ncbi:transaldolase [Leptolyngbya sp. FACHB-261]|uniref:transaldolase n=1 Tax=Leptolyngbya sp. FACHB-261 TaxID=2692806 RepID=UPI0016882B7D|nr:transaldolase [Leptolyngbya sp. FACHB-261]MBD2103570.1 transaldolase [Leptolyngbya sp. FACHB-261]
MTATNPLFELKEHGQSVWLDNLTRDLIQSGELKRLIETRGLRGITSNPAIFEKAINGNAIYDADIETGAKAGKSVEDIYESLVIKDIQDACDIFQGIYEESDGLDGYISIEVSPTLAHDAEGTVRDAVRLYETIGRKNVMIKIPGTSEAAQAISEVVGRGINVNVTLLFSVQDYENAAYAYIEGLEKFAATGGDISKVASVASFFLSRIDSNIDDRIEAMLKGDDDLNKEAQLRAYQGKIAIANAKLAYEKYKGIYASDRWQALAAKGAKVQRLLWASTGTKNPNYSDVMYVDELVGPDTVNTMPPQTVEACADHCDIQDRIETGLEGAHRLIDSLPEIGINLDDVMRELQVEGIEKFVQPYTSLLNSLQEKIQRLTPA